MKLFDLHCDTLTTCHAKQQSLTKNTCHFNFERISSICETWVQTMAVYIPDQTRENEALQYALQMISFLEVQLKDREDITWIKCAEDLQNCKRGILLAVENGVVVGHELSRIRQLASLGVVYITLTWNGTNPIGNGCLSDNSEGLTMFGKSAVQEMFRVGILPDVSHLNPAGFWDVAECSNGRPFIATHSVSEAIHKHPRNLSDEQFSAICSSEGLVGLNLCESQLGEQSFDCFERHFYHLLTLGGENSIALGMDLDGTDLPSAWNGIDVAPSLYEHLLQKRYPESVVRKLFFENSYAFFVKALTTKEKCNRIGT